MGLPCLNCKKDVTPDVAKIYSGVFLCPDCFFVASRFEERITSELKSLLLIAREAIRIAAVKGELRFSPAESMADLSKKEVLESILKMSEMKDVHDRTARGGHTSQQPAATAARQPPPRQLGVRGGSGT